MKSIYAAELAVIKADHDLAMAGEALARAQRVWIEAKASATPATKTYKNTYRISNYQGAFLADITAKNAKSALKKARLVWSGPIYAMGFGNASDRAPITGYSR